MKPSITIHLQDQGQDLLKWNLNSKREVISVQPSLQTYMWKGCTVPLFFIEEYTKGDQIPFLDPEGMARTLNLGIERIEKHKLEDYEGTMPTP